MYFSRVIVAGLFVLSTRFARAAESPPSSDDEFEQLTYWVDQSCSIDRFAGGENRAARFHDALGEAINFAKRAYERLQDPSDNLAESYSQRIFKGRRDDDTIKESVFHIYKGIMEMEQTNDHVQSEIRFYCDDDDYGPGFRWTLVPDIIVPVDEPQPVPNSQKTLGEDQEWEDKINGIRRGVDTVGCKDEGTMGETYFKPTPDPRYDNQNGLRATITLCDLPLSQNIQATTNFPEGTDLTQKGAVHILGQAMSSLTLLHELTHWSPYFDTLDIELDDGSEAIGWEALQDLEKLDATINADSFTYFGFLAVLADRGFRLPDDDQEAHNGDLIYDDSLLTRQSTKS